MAGCGFGDKSEKFECVTGLRSTGISGKTLPVAATGSVQNEFQVPDFDEFDISSLLC
jgi:hypothetical protein